MKTFFSLLLTAAALFTQQVMAADDDYIYCLCTWYGMDGVRNDNIYFSDIFLGDYSSVKATLLTIDFSRYIERQYGRSCWAPFCSYEDSFEDAKYELEKAVADSRKEPVMTRWKPGGSSGERFKKQPLQDFHISIDDDSAELEVCVRDYECEDGDEIRVSVDGDEVFEGEIDNGWDCSRLDVRAGRKYPIELYAINGTGFKGNCAHRDVNTGEIRVTGATSVTQSWRHRGGTGSRAKIIVDVK